MTSRRNFLTIAGAASLGLAPTFQIARAQSKKLRFGVGPFLPSAEETLTPDEAKALLPNRYTGFVKSNHKMYAVIEKAGIAVGRIKAKA